MRFVLILSQLYSFTNMDIPDFDEGFDFSLINSDNLFPDSLTASPAREPILEQNSDSSSHEASDDEDGLDDRVALQHVEDNCNEGSFGDGEQVVVASDQYSWKIEHARGDHKFKGAFRYIWMALPKQLTVLKHRILLPQQRMCPLMAVGPSTCCKDGTQLTLEAGKPDPELLRQMTNISAPSSSTSSLSLGSRSSLSHSHQVGSLITSPLA
jgi:hypothetical protein